MHILAISKPPPGITVEDFQPERVVASGVCAASGCVAKTGYTLVDILIEDFQ